jgi:hypothetical protein
LLPDHQVTRFAAGARIFLGMIVAVAYRFEATHLYIRGKENTGCIDCH